VYTSLNPILKEFDDKSYNGTMVFLLNSTEHGFLLIPIEHRVFLRNIILGVFCNLD